MLWIEIVGKCLGRHSLSIMQTSVAAADDDDTQPLRVYLLRQDTQLSLGYFYYIVTLLFSISPPLLQKNIESLVDAML